MHTDHLDKLKKALRGKTAVFMDAANLEQSVKGMYVVPQDIPNALKKHTTDRLCWRVDYEGLRKFFEATCNLTDIRFYSATFGTKPHFVFLGFLRKRLGFTLETKPLKEYADHTPEEPHRKANFDVEIATDATFTMDNYDTFVLFSGDCDFEYLLKFLRGQQKTTVVFSRSGHIAKELPPASNFYFDIVDFRHAFLRMTHKPDSPNAKNPA